MARRIAYGLIPGAAILLVAGTALGQGMQTFKKEQAAQRIARPIPSYGSTSQVRIITSRAILGMVARGAAVMFAKLKPTKTACRHG
jgi:hypothetical protein